MARQEQPKRGLAALSPERRQQIARLGARALHAQGKARCWTSEEAKIAGRKGGLATQRKRVEH